MPASNRDLLLYGPQLLAYVVQQVVPVPLHLTESAVIQDPLCCVMPISPDGGGGSQAAGYEGKVKIGMDVAASEFMTEDGKYDLDFKNKPNDGSQIKTGCALCHIP